MIDEAFNPEIIIRKISEVRQEAFWYYDFSSIARYQFPNGKKLYVGISGDIDIQFDEDRRARGSNAVREAELRNMDDESIVYECEWLLNNWFAIHLVDIEGNVIGDDLGVAHTYDDAIELIKQVAKEQFKLMYREI